MSALRIAIIGAGPKGTSALERLVARARAAGSRVAPMVVDIYEPHPFPGAGPVYDPRQPGYLRMNVASDLVDAWWTPDRVCDDHDHPSFATWNRDALDATPFPARARVGRYLAEAFGRIVADAPAELTVRVLPHRVTRVMADADQWRIEASGSESADLGEPYDEVLLATGHAGDWAGALDAADTRVFPVDRELSLDRVAPGAIVAMRGFALTGIDASLALTEGRGGSFHPVPGHPWRLTYEAGERQVARIQPFTRTGLLMLAKPEPGMLDDVPGLAEIGARARMQLRAAAEDELMALLGVIVDDTANELIAAIAPHRPARRFEEASSSPIDDLVRSLDVATAMACPDRSWAIGHAWRIVYPEIVDRVGCAALSHDDWDHFASLAATNERRAFGPPPVNAAKLVALVDAGIIDLDHLDDAAAARLGADVVIDAVLPSPGARDLDVPVLDELLRAGAARIVEGRRGLDVLDDGTCLDDAGRPSAGLAAIGRPTEDSIIGNDTLSRSLHHIADRWAARITRRAATIQPTEPPHVRIAIAATTGSS